MTRLFEQFPADTQNAILAVLTEKKVRFLESQIDPQDVHEAPVIASGDKIRGVPRMSHPITRLYQACLREMGPMKHGLPRRKAPPTPGNAWLELMRHVADGIGKDEPAFEHKEIIDTIAYFGGWSEMWAEFNAIKMQTARGKFIYAYKDILQGYSE